MNVKDDWECGPSLLLIVKLIGLCDIIAVTVTSTPRMRLCDWSTYWTVLVVGRIAPNALVWSYSHISRVFAPRYFRTLIFLPDKSSFPSLANWS